MVINAISVPSNPSVGESQLNGHSSNAEQSSTAINTIPVTENGLKSPNSSVDESSSNAQPTIADLNDNGNNGNDGDLTTQSATLLNSTLTPSVSGDDSTNGVNVVSNAQNPTDTDIGKKILPARSSKTSARGKLAVLSDDGDDNKASASKKLNGKRKAKGDEMVKTQESVETGKKVKRAKKK